MCNAKRLCELLTTVFSLHFSHSVFVLRIHSFARSYVRFGVHTQYALHSPMFCFVSMLRTRTYTESVSKHWHVCNCGQHELIEFETIHETNEAEEEEEEEK